MARMTKEQKELIKQLDKMESKVKAAFLEYVKVTRSPDTIEEIQNLIDQGLITEAIALVDRNIAATSLVLNNVIAEAGQAESTRLSRLLPAATIALSFDPSHPAAARIAQETRFQFVQQVTESQRNSIRGAMVRSFDEGLGAVATANAFRDSIGLTARQEQAVNNYRRLLVSRDRQALERGLRDRRHDRTVARSIADDKPLTNAQIDAMVDRYRSRYIQYRAEVVARTESVRATSLARHESMMQTLEATGVDQDSVKRVWNATQDDRTRDAHASMGGQTVKIGEPFMDGDGNELMYPGDPDAPIETTVQCRCVVTFEFES